MAIPEAVLMARGRRAYEWGRVRAALPTVAVVAPMAAASLLLGARDAASGLCALLLAGVLLAALWRGQALARGARAGLVAGLLPFALPLAACLHACAGGRCFLAPMVCVAAGVAAGILLVLRGRPSADPGAGSDLRTALLVAALAGALGCLVSGAGGVAGMAAGLALGAGPVLWRRTRA